MDELIGTIKMWAGNFAPKDWAFCDGSILQVSSNKALFSIIGSKYGGDGQTTFALPNLQARFPMGVSGSYALGTTGGNNSVALQANNLPAHNHTLNVSNQQAVSVAPASNMVLGSVGVVDGSSGQFYADQMYVTSAPNTQLSNASIGNTGSNVPINTMPAYVAVNFIICTEGVYPSRNDD